MVSFVGSGTTSQERDIGDYGCTLRWTQRSCLLEAQLPHQHQGWPLLEARGTPRSTAAPPLSRCHSLSLAYCRPRLHTWAPTPEGQTQPARDRATNTLRLFVTSTGSPLSPCLLHGTQVGDQALSVTREQTTPWSKELTTGTQGLGRSATESQAEGEAEQVMMRLASPGPLGMQILGGPISQSPFKPIFKTYSTW